jgi:peptidyl-prolyl cis-trans isomerase B (cyclophilin B)
MRRLSAIVLLLCSCVLLLAACGGDDDKGSGGEATATPTTEAPAGETEVGCKKVEKPKPKEDGGQDKPTITLDKSKTYTAKIATSCGEFDIALDVKRAPKTAASFVSLAKAGFFDDTTFHRIVPGFVIQGGDPLGSGTGGPGYSVKEAPPKDLQYTRGVVAMAKTGTEPPGTSGSQFFVVTGEDAGLPPDYALLGKVSGGEDVVDKIATVPTDATTEAPTDPVVIESVTIEEG